MRKKKIISQILDYLYSSGFSGIARHGNYNIDRYTLEIGIHEYLKTGKDVLQEIDKFIWESWREWDDKIIFSKKDIAFWKKALNKETFFNIYHYLNSNDLAKIKEKIEFSINFWKEEKSKIKLRRQLSNKKFREKIFNLKGRKCCQCNSINNLEIDHIIPISNGGKNNIENLQILCLHCHKLKTKKDGKKHGRSNT